MATNIIKLSDEVLALIPGATKENFSEKFTAFHRAAKEMETAMAAQPDFAALEGRIAKLESATPAAGVTEARVKELVTAELGSDASKKSIEAIAQAKASATVIEASAATGTQPVKPAPAPAAGETNVKDLISAGKFEEAYAASAELQKEFPDAKCFAAYAKSEAAGRVSFASSPKTK